MFRATLILTACALAFTAAPDPVFAKEKGCPPGLAKKNPPCVPPGLAKKGVTAQDWQASRDDDDDDDFDGYREDEYLVLETGDRVTIDGTEFIVVRRGDELVLKRDDDWFRLPGTRDDYVRVGDSLIRVNPETRAVIEIMELADLLLN